MVNLSFLFVSTILFLVFRLPTTTDLSKKKIFFLRQFHCIDQDGLELMEI